MMCWNQVKVVIPLSFMLSVVGCTAITIQVNPESRILAVDQDAGIGCLDDSSTVATQVDWSTTATSANISTQTGSTFFVFRYYELVLTGVDSGYCGQYTCTFNDSALSATTSITVEPVFEESLMGNMVHIEAPDLELTLTCTVYGGPGNAVSIVWSGPAVQSQPAIVEINDGNFTSNLSLTNATMFFSGVYECTARYNNSLCTTSISSDLRLDIIAPPSIISQTQSPYVVNSGVNVGLDFQFLAHPSFTDVNCSGPNGEIKVNSPGFSFNRANSDSNFQIILSTTVSNVNYIHGGNYLCTANNSAGTITATILLIVRPVVEPQQVLARNGDNVSLTCLVQSFPEPFYMWEKYVDSNDSDSLPDMFSSSFGNSENRETGPLLTFEPIQYGDAGLYRCVVTFNATLEVSSNGSLLAVSPEDSVAVEAVNMSVLFDPNEEATLNCNASGGPNNTFLWFFKGQLIEGATTDVLHLSQVEGGKYICQVSNVAGRENASIVLTEVPHDVAMLSNLDFDIAPLGDNVTLRCITKGGPNNTYTWMKDSIILDGETRDTLNLTSIVPSSSGIYNCTVSNAAGYDSASIALFVSPEGSVEASPTITYGNHSDNATFICFAMGGPDNIFSWTHVRSNTVAVNDSVLVLVDLMASDGGQYECLVENRAGRDNVDVTLNVSPMVTEHPQDMNVTIIEGIIILTCTATGFPSPTITWFHNDTLDVIESYATETVNVYTTKSTFTRSSPMTNDSGWYFCRAAIDGYDDVNSDIVTVLVQDVPDNPKSITALEIQSRSLGLSWIEPHDNNAPIQGYFVIYVQPTFAGGERLVKSTSDVAITLTELFPGVAYNFTVIAYNDIGNSTESEAIHIRTLEEAPMGSPLNVRATSITSTTIHVTWEEVPPIDRNGIITTYEVLYEPLETFDILMSLTVNTTNLSLLLVELHPFVSYNISLRAYTSIGSGPYSESILERTQEDRPGMPVNVSTLANSSSDIIVYWEEVPAISRNGVILFYEVLFCSTLNCSKTQSLNTTDATTFTLVINHLEEFTEYNITVRAYTQVGAGESAPALVTRTLVNEPVISAVFPSNTISIQGENITFRCLPVGRFIDSYLWEKDGMIVGNDETLEVIVDASSGGIYTCTVSNAAGTDSNFTTLYIEPFINVPLNDQTLAINGTNVNISCDAAGFPPPNVSWVDTLGLKVSNTSQLQFSPVLFGDKGNYHCVLTAEINGMNFSARDETTLTVSPEGSVVVSPLGIISRLGDTVTLTCIAMGGPNNTFRWEKDRTVIGNDSVLNLVSIDASYGGDYSCIVSNAAGTDSASTTLYVPPYIVTPLEKQILVTIDGSSVNISCDAAGFPTPIVNWMNMLNMNVSNTSQLLFNPVAFGDEGLYRCIASAEINGTIHVAIDETTLNISPEGSISPLNIVVRLDDAATLECSALGGPGNLFLWRKNGKIIGNDSVLNLESINASDGGTYTCIISNAAGNDSVFATLYVAPYIDIPLVEQTLATNGSNVNIICNAAGFPIPNVTWVDSLGLEVSNTFQLMFNPVLFGDQGIYRCVASTEINEASFNATNETTLIVSPEGSAIVSPLDIIANLNDSITFICNAMGGPSNSFQWEINGTIVSNDNVVSLVAIDASYGGNYTCIVSNAAGTDSASTTLYVAPYIVSPLDKQTLTVNGSNVIIFCNTAGFPSPTVSWIDPMGMEISTTSLIQFNPIIFGLEGIYRCVAENVVNQSTFNIADETTLIVSPEDSVQVSPQDRISSQGDILTLVCTAMGGPSNSFTWTMDGNIVGYETMLSVIDINASHGGNYSCTVSNAAGNDSASTTLYVAPYIVTQPDAETLAVNGSNLYISCNASGFPAPKVKWVDMQGSEVSNSSQLQFRPVQFGDEGLYRCAATTEIGETTFTAMNETILIVSPEGSVTISPLDVIATFGDNVTFNCTAMGGPNSTFQWVKNGNVVGNDNILNLVAINASFGGIYSCIVNNSAGTDSASTTLYVAPYIVIPLEKQILVAVDGSSLNISCDTAGFPSPTVTWMNMLNMEVSSTSQLMFNPISFGSKGVYHCVASAVINRTSFTATDETTIIISPKGSVSPLNITARLEDNATLVCSSIGGPGNSFLWEMNGRIVGNDSRLNLESINASDGGTYTCIISNAAGNDSVSATLYVAPYIDNPLEEQTLVANGSNVNIICSAAGFPIPNVKWIDSLGLEVSNISQLKFSPVIFGDEGAYRCVASTVFGEEIFTATNETTLIVSPEGSSDILPLNVSTFNDDSTLICTTMGGPNNTFQWEMNGTIVGNDSKLTLIAIDASYGGNYTCIVSNAAGADSASTTLYVAPYIVTPLDKQTLAVNGSNVVISCNAAGFPTPTVSWIDPMGMEISTTSLLQFNPIIFGLKGIYRCVAENVVNQSTFNITDETTLTVSPEGSVQVSPQDRISFQGDILTLVCTAMGGPSNSFTWTMDGSIVGNETMLNVIDINASHGGNYSCTVSNAAGNDSASTTLYVAPYIVTQLEGEILAVNGSSLNINCTAAGSPAPMVKWVDMQGIEVSNSSQLQFSPVMFGDEGLYRCVATTKIGESFFTAVNETTIIVSPEGSVTVSPIDIVATFGDNVTFTCSAMGSSNSTFQWKRNGTIVGHDSILNLSAIDVSYGGNYSCIVSNIAGTDTASTTLYVAPYIVTPLEKLTPTGNGSYVNINCDALGFPIPNVKWLNMLEFEVSNTSRLQFNPVMFGDEGVYTCVASAKVDGTDYNATDETTLIVSPKDSVTVSSPIVSNVGDNVTLFCIAMGGPENTFQWEINGNIIENDSNLTFVVTNASYGGNYTCAVSNAAGTESASTTLYVAPYIDTPLEKDISVTNGSNISINCGAAGFPTPTVKWMKLDLEVSSTVLLQFNSVMFGDQGIYRCVASTEINGTNYTITDQTTLNVSPEGSVAVSPLDAVFNFGDYVTLVCIAKGGPDNSFQWEMNGNVIGNDSTVTLVDIDASHGGDYMCTVSNAAGTESTSTTLYVAPYIIPSFEEQILAVNGSSVNITCNAAGFPTPSVKWVDMLDLEVSSLSQLEFSPVFFGDGGVYHCVAFTDIGGMNFTTRNETTLIISPEGGVWVNPTLINGSHGGNATFTCFALGGPQNVFSWKNLRSNSVIANDSELMIFDIMASDGGQYQCSAENPAGEDSINVTLNVSPIVTGHPQAQNVTNLEGTIQLSCTVTGFPLPGIIWFHNNTLEDSNLSSTDTINVYTTRSIFIKSMAVLNDSGTYFCKAVIGGYDDMDSNMVIVLVQDIPEQPQNLTTLGIMSRSVVFTWMEPHDNNAPILGYFVLYKQPSFAGGEEVVQQVADKTVHVFELLPGVTYNLTVIAYNEIGNSTESESLTVKTLEEAPSSPPQNVQLMSLSSTSILVSWAELPIIDRNGLIILYEILCEPNNTFNQLASRTKNTTGLSVLLMDLQPFVTYAISVRAYTSVGHGPYSEISLSRTQEDAPSAPTNITAIEIASTYAIISWATPEFPNGIIRSYTVLVTKNNGVLVSNMSTPEMAVNITDLSPFVQYWLVVFAQTVEIGEGSANFSLLTAEAAPSVPRNVTVIEIASTYVIISWRAPEFPNGNIRNYTVSLTERGGHFMQIVLTNETLVNVTDLSPFVHYWVVVFAETIEIGEKSENITFRTSEESTFISIDVQPEIPIQFGQNATITCVDTGAMTPVNWSTTALSAQLSNQQEMFTFESQRRSELHLTRVDSGYCGNYTCILPNSDMTGSVYVDIVPRFEESLTDTLVYIESPHLKIILTCSVNGGAGSVDIVWSGPAVQFQPATIQTDHGIFTSNLILTRATMFVSGMYQCTAGYDNSLCIANVSSNVRLDVVAPPSIVDQTQSPHIVDKGVNLSLLFEFAAHPSFTNVHCSGPDGDIKMNTSSITLTRFDNDTTFQVRLLIDISIVNHVHGGMYTCAANNTAGDMSATVLLLVRPVVDPELNLAKMGDNVTLRCLAQSFPMPSYLWEAISMTDSGGSGSILDVFNMFQSGNGENRIVTQPTLEFKSVEYGDNGNYRCVITFNRIWQVSSNEVLIAVSPEGSVEIVNERVLFNPNEVATLKCRAGGGPNNTFLWFFNGVIIEAATIDVLNLIHVEGGEYTCQVSNIAGSENASVILIEAPHAVVLSSDVRLNVATVHNNVTLLCNNDGGPDNAYEWRKDGIILNNEINNTLRLYSINVTSGGDYTCTVSNAAGNDSTTTMLFVAPFIVTPLEEETPVFNGSYVNVSCEADGFPPPTVTWVNMTSMEVSNTTLLEFSPVLVRDEGLYRCVATLEVEGGSIEATDETKLIVSSPTCRPEEVSTNITTFKWPETNSGSFAFFTCPNNMLFTVERYCIPGGHWDTFSIEGCGTLAPILDMLVVQNLTNETLVETVEELSNLVQETEERPVEQSAGNLESIANVLVNVATFVNESDIEINETIVQDVVEVLNSLTQWTPITIMANTSSRIVMSFETVTTTYTRQIPVNMTITFKTPFVTVTAENTAAMTLQITGRNLSFNNDASTSDGPVSPGELSPDQDAAISLPASLFERVNDQENVGVFFAFYETSTLFPVGRENAVSDNNTARQTQVGSQIVAATVDSSKELTDLENPVTIVFRLQFNTSLEFLAPESEMCVSWDFSLQDWITRGCDTRVGQNHIITCTCNHLTNFAVLVDICSRQEDCQPSKVESLLSYVSYIGMPISIVCLIATVLTLTVFKKLRQKDISKYHIQLALSLLFMLIVALALVILSAGDITPHYGGCLIISIVVHYFALVSTMFMAAEALLMFRKLATPFEKITSKYNIIASVICWSVPVLPVLIPLIVDLAGGSDPANDIVIRREEQPTLCFLSHVGAFWGAFLAPVLAIMLFNTVLFVFISVVLVRHVRRKSLRKVETSNHKVIFRTSLSIFGLMCLFGLTWLFAVFTFSATGLREAFQVLFTVFNSLQGAFIFIFTCVLSSEAREGWKSVFTFKSKSDHTRLSQYSSYKPGSSSTGTSTLHSGHVFVNTLLRRKKKKRRKEDPLLRTISVSAAVPEDDEYDDVFGESDSEIEYQLQVKPKTKQTDQVPTTAGIAMEMVAIPRKDSEVNMISLLGEDIESSVTMFVNDGFIDVTESEMVIEEYDTQSMNNNSTEKPDADNELKRTPSTSTIATDSEVDGYTFYETDSEKEFQLQINPTAQKASHHPLDRAIEVIAVTKRPTAGEEVESSVAVYINTAQSKPPLPQSGKRIWKLSSN